MTRWRLAKSLEKLREQINLTAPNRSRISDGSVGDAAHASRASDHNPWLKVQGMGVVTAIDITHDPANGVDGHKLSRELIADKRTKYVIFNSEIWKARTKKWESYTGLNAHRKHVHISIQPVNVDDVTPWKLDGRPVLRLGDKGEAVKELQTKLRLEGYSLAADGDFGKITQSVVRRFQGQQKLTVDGIVGAATWRALG